MNIGKYEQYEPKVVRDDVGNPYLPISRYEATAVRDLINKIKSMPMPTDNTTPQLNTGDWFYDLPVKIDKWLEKIDVSQ